MTPSEIEGGPVDPLAGHPQALRPLTAELVAAVLTTRGYACRPDADGNLVGRWGDSLIWFRRLGAAGEVLQVRTLTGPVFPIEDVPDLRVFCNGWNHDRYWPKAFVVVDDDGRARVCGEVITDLERGVTPHQLDQLVGRGVTAGCHLADAVAARAGQTHPSGQPGGGASS
ncbi:YbjN domain-containing protein [Micromonospora sp. WMMD882]|uniref:YbjN domain-containing protein n=1 Tax=Micromonospora sp. WMMD882 TaxID=3015151 RepID=UPI00248C539B|nr:YbjN domain-containing protein [Micromonospora sp. WMMD882]WBB81846.1 YbjN domain-containing protein [Micromonospora sp. WMMD882]